MLGTINLFVHVKLHAFEVNVPDRVSIKRWMAHLRSPFFALSLTLAGGVCMLWPRVNLKCHKDCASWAEEMCQDGE